MSKMLLSLLGPVLIGPLTFLVMQWLKRLNDTIDTLPSSAKRITVVAVAAILTLVANVTGIDLHCDATADTSCLALLDQDTVKALVASAVAFGLHALKTAKSPKA